MVASQGASWTDIIQSRETLVVLPSDFTPLQRILLTANGNVQRTLSAYFNTKITCKIIKNEQSLNTQGNVVFDRQVNLLKDNETTMLCDAKSIVTISDPEILKLITHENAGIGQLFQRLNVLPRFELIQLGKTHEFFWREYTLKHTGITCHIHEFFPISLYGPSLQV